MQDFNAPLRSALAPTSVKLLSQATLRTGQSHVLHDMNFFIHALNVEKASATTIRGRAVR